MTGLREVLARLRSSGAPGPAAGGGGVPADRTAELTAELEPPLRLLDDTMAEAARIRAGAAEEAAVRRRRAAGRAEDLVRAARESALEVGRATAARVQEEAEAEAECTDTAAREAAQRLRERTGARIPAFAERVVARVAAELTAVEDGRAGEA